MKYRIKIDRSKDGSYTYPNIVDGDIIELDPVEDEPKMVSLDSVLETFDRAVKEGRK